MSEILDHQRIIINDIISSNESESLLGKIESAEKEIEKTSEITSKLQTMLSVLKKSAQTEKKDVGTILKNALIDVRNQIWGLIVMSVDNGVLDVPITAIHDIHQQISTMVDNMVENGEFVETDDEFLERTAKIRSHNNRVMKFVKRAIDESKEPSIERAISFLQTDSDSDSYF